MSNLSCQNFTSPPFSSFKNCLDSVSLPDQFLTGIRVIRVMTNGKVRKSILKLSPDKFTIHISAIKGSSPIKSFRGSPTSPQSASSSSSTATNILRPILRKISSGGGISEDDMDEHFTIDIASILRIQKGQTTMKFEWARKTCMKSTMTAPLYTKHHPLPFNDTPAEILDVLSSFSIIHSGGCTVDFILVQEDEPVVNGSILRNHSSSIQNVGRGNLSRDDIVQTLEQLRYHLFYYRTRVGNDIYLLRYHWEDIDKDKTDALNATELSLLLDRINYKRTDSLSDEYNKFTKLLELSKTERKRGLTFDQCATFLHKVKRDTWQVKPVHHLWIQLFGEIMSNGKPRTQVSAASFLSRFLQRKQQDHTSTIEDVRKLFKNLNKLEIAKVASHGSSDDNHIDKDRFEAFLLSLDNDAFDPSREIYQDECLNQPLAAYWINSSHNTYLTGDQLYSRSSVETYYSALHRGVRCVEVDCWDGDKDLNDNPIPIVYHGHTMTSKIPLCDIVEAINDFLVQNPSSLPVIISLENHCSLPYQEVMAKLFIQIFGDRLYMPTEQSLLGSLPSPNSLKGMVVIKGRRFLEEELGIDTTSDDTSLEDDDSTIGISDVPQSSEDRELQHVNSTESLNTILSPELSQITLFHKMGLKDFIDSARSPTFHMHSFVESQVRRLCRRRDNSDWMWYNTDHLTRTYPSGKRVDSSNYSPIPAWAMGCQLNALNTQHPDYVLSLNDGRFRVNGSCGYVLKPPLHIKAIPTAPVSPWTVLVKVLSGTCLPKPRADKKAKCIDPFVKVCLYDIPMAGGNEIITTFSTGIVTANGYFPIWNHDFFIFRVENPVVSMLSFSVHDKDDECLASASIPIDCLRVGYRSVRLFDSINERWGPYSCASLLVEIEIRKRERSSPSTTRDSY